MRISVVLLVAVLAVCAATLALAESESSQQTHVVHTGAGKVVITIKRGVDEAGEESSEGGFGAAPAKPPRGAGEDESAAEQGEESSEESSESGAHGRSESVGPLQRFTLPPEPAAARGYKSPNCGEDPCEEQTEIPLLSEQRPPCTENCEAEQDNNQGVAGPVTISQPLGDLDVDSGFFPVRDTQVYANSGPGPSSDDTIIVPQTGLSSSMGTTVHNQYAGIVGTIQSAAASSPQDETPEMGTRYKSPEMIKAEKLAALDREEARARETERNKMTQELQQHMKLLEKINDMARNLRYQYSNIRRHHNVLRSAIAGNKMALDQLGGDNEWAGTDYDIEKPVNEPVYQDIEEVEALKPAKNHPFVEKLMERTNELFKFEQEIQKRDQTATRDAARQFFGTKKIPLQEGDKEPPKPNSPHLAKVKQLIADMKQVKIPLDRVATVPPKNSLLDEAKALEDALKA